MSDAPRAHLCVVSRAGGVSSRLVKESSGRAEFDMLCRAAHVAYVQITFVDGTYDWYARPVESHTGGVHTGRCQ